MPMSGDEILKLYLKNGWRFARQRGSHVIVQKDGEAPETIPMHRELKKGLEQKLLKRLKGKK